MFQSYLIFRFASEAHELRRARQQLESWRQAFRLGTRLQFKIDVNRVQTETQPGSEPTPPSSGDVELLVRLEFSPHERRSFERWVERLRREEPFRSALIRELDGRQPSFAEMEERFRLLG